MLSATGITAFAEDNTTTVSCNVDQFYTVTIPATVALGDADVTANITASNVLFEDGKQVKVDLTSASNTESGSTFNAKNGNSAVTYTITADKAVSVGDTVATFTENGSKTLTFSAADKSGVTAGGRHTETLTFTIAVEDAAYIPRTYTALSSGDVLKPGDTIDSDKNYDFSDQNFNLNKYYTWTLIRADVTVDKADQLTVTEKDDGAYYLFKVVDRVYGYENYSVFYESSGLIGAFFDVTSTSDGVVITQSSGSWNMEVHEP